MTLWNWPLLRNLALLRRATLALESLAASQRDLLALEKRRLARQFPERAVPRPTRIEVATVDDFNSGHRDAYPELYPEAQG